MLGDVAPAVVLGVEAPHPFDRIQTAVVDMVGAPRVVHVDGIDAPREGEAAEQVFESLERETAKWFRHKDLQ
jgi:hypothetical protein